MWGVCAHAVTSKHGIKNGLKGLDIGHDSARSFAKIIARAKTIVWNGPMGVCELKPFASGSKVCVVCASDAMRCRTCDDAHYLLLRWRGELTHCQLASQSLSRFLLFSRGVVACPLVGCSLRSARRFSMLWRLPHHKDALRSLAARTRCVFLLLRSSRLTVAVWFVGCALCAPEHESDMRQCDDAGIVRETIWGRAERT